MRILFVTPECAPLRQDRRAGRRQRGAAGGAARAGHRRLGIAAGLSRGAEGDGGLGARSARFSELGHECRLLQKNFLLVVDCPALYRRDGDPYQDPGGQDWPDNALRFGVPVQGRRAAARRSYDVVHCNDWPTALTPAAHETRRRLLTIHNLAFQGNFGRRVARAPRAARSAVHHGQARVLRPALVPQGRPRAGADALTTVSPTYAREIQTAELGCGLDGLLRHRRDALTGILNGIDTRNLGSGDRSAARAALRRLIARAKGGQQGGAAAALEPRGDARSRCSASSAASRTRRAST